MLVDLSRLPKTPGIYFFKDKKQKIIYIGAASNLRRRVSSYFQKTHKDKKTKKLVEEIKYIDYKIFPDIESTFLEEIKQIKNYLPKYNIQYKDDKDFPRLKITISEDYPRLLIVRENENQKDLYFGRKTNAKKLRTAKKHLRKMYKLCSCSQPVKPKKSDRPCLDYHIGLCSAPCTENITKKKYNKNVEGVVKLLRGHDSREVKLLEAEMYEHSQKNQFEEAAKIRDKIRTINSMTKIIRGEDNRELDIIFIDSGKKITLFAIYMINNDQLVYEYFKKLEKINELDLSVLLEELIKHYYLYSHSIPKKVLIPKKTPNFELISEWLSNRNCNLILTKDSKKTNLIKRFELKFQKDLFQIDNKVNVTNISKKGILTDLKNILDLDVIPKRIECFDISVIQGKFAVGSLVTFLNGEKYSKGYRKYKIKLTLNKNDDVSMMKEVFYRRYRKKREPLPDLIMLDGGKGQLNAIAEVKDVLNLKIPIIALAKKNEEIYIENMQKPLKLLKIDPALHLLQRIRNEAHRFAISFHRKLRKQATTTSTLDGIPGIGKKRKKLLLQEFGSIIQLKKASIDDISNIKGINKILAEKVYIHLHK